MYGKLSQNTGMLEKVLNTSNIDFTLNCLRDVLYDFRINKRQRIPKAQSKHEQSRETGNIGYTKTNQKHNIICVGHHCMHTNTANVSKT